MKELETLYPLDIPDEINHNDVYLLLLYNDFDISMNEIIDRIKWREERDKEIERMLF